jgi:hypothetical protein
MTADELVAIIRIITDHLDWEVILTDCKDELEANGFTWTDNHARFAKTYAQQLITNYTKGE